MGVNLLRAPSGCCPKTPTNNLISQNLQNFVSYLLFCKSHDVVWFLFMVFLAYLVGQLLEYRETGNDIAVILLVQCTFNYQATSLCKLWDTVVPDMSSCDIWSKITHALWNNRNFSERLKGLQLQCHFSCKLPNPLHASSVTHCFSKTKNKQTKDYKTIKKNPFKVRTAEWKESSDIWNRSPIVFFTPHPTVSLSKTGLIYATQEQHVSLATWPVHPARTVLRIMQLSIKMRKKRDGPLVYICHRFWTLQ